MGALIQLGNHAQYRNGATFALTFNQLINQSTAAFSLRRLNTAATLACRVRRSGDNTEQNIGFATAVQTRTNLDPVPAADGDSRTSAGITRTVVGTGTEFGQSYIDIRWNGTATAAVNLRYCSTPLTASPTAASSALVTPGQTYTSSVGYRLVAGTWPAALTARMTQFFRNGTALVNEANNALPANPNAVLQRSAVIGVAAAATNNVSNIFQADGLSGLVVDFTMRFYAPNTELGTGNARPLLQRYTPEVIANIGDLDAESLLTFVSGNSGLVTTMYDQVPKLQNLLLRSEEVGQAPWVTDNGGAVNPVVTANFALAPNGTMTADRVQFDKTGGVSSRLQQTPVLPSDTYTYSVFLKNNRAGVANVGVRIAGVGVNYVVTQDWQRFSVSTTAATPACQILLFDGIAGNDETADILVWGNQLNVGATATDYIKTEGTNSPVNNYNAVQAVAANQPRIINGGAMETENGRPTVVSDGNQWLVSGNAANWTRSTVSGMSNAVLFRRSGTAFAAAIGASATSPSFGYLEMASAVGGFRLNTRSTPFLDTAAVGSFSSLAVVNGIATPTSLNLRVNGTSMSSLTGSTMTPITPTSGLVVFDRIPLVSSGSNFAGAISEVIVFKDVTLSITDAQTIERNQGAFYFPTILDQISTFSTAAYSLRKLSQGYAGFAIRVRRSSDQSEQNIGFTQSGDLNVAELLSFVGSGNGFVTTWYDQSTNGYNATQATAASQPQIVTSGVVNLKNGKPAILNASTTGFGVSAITSLPASNSVSAVASNTGTSGRIVSLRASVPLNPFLDYTASTTIRYFIRDDSAINTILLNQTVVAFSLNVLTAIRNVNTGSLFVNGNAITGSATPSAIGTTTTITGMGIGCDISPIFGAGLVGSLSEIVIFSSAVSTTDRQILERNQGSYYGITII